MPTFLAQRWKDKRGGNRYHCAGGGRGFFVEVGIEEGQEPAVVRRSFNSAGSLSPPLLM